MPAADDGGAAAARAASRADFGEAARRIAASVVDLEIVGADGRQRHAAGFALEAGGLIATAEHAVGGARRITARLGDGRRVTARPVGADPLSDVAVIRLPEGIDLPPVVRASGRPQRGQAVAAIGNPLGYGGTLTAGVISASERSGGPESPYDVVQHDAALNPGSSGGPLIDLAGAVVGMNVAIADGARRDVGIALAVPVEVVATIGERLIRDGAVPRPRLGLRVRDAAALREAIPVLIGDGVLIETVEPGSAAARAGLLPGRLIVAADGRPVRTTRDIARALEPHRPGETFRLVVLDGDGAAAIDFRLDRSGPAGGGAAAEAAIPARLGLEIGDGDGIVRAVGADGPADLAGLRVGDRLLAVGLTRIDADHPAGAVLDAAIATAGAGGIALLAERDGATRWLIVDRSGRLDTMAPFGSNSEAAASVVL